MKFNITVRSLTESFTYVDGNSSTHTEAYDNAKSTWKNSNVEVNLQP